MKHLDFIIWLLGFPIMWEICDYIKAKAQPNYQFSKIDSTTGLFFIIVWFGVAYLIF